MKEYFTLAILIASVVLATPQLLIMTMITTTAPSSTAYGQQIESDGGLTLFQNIADGFRVQVPEGWIIQDVNNTGSVLLEEVTQGYGILAQICQEEQQLLQAAPNFGSSSEGSCEGAQENIIYILRYPNLDTGLQSAFGVSANSITTDNVLLYHVQKLQQVGYRSIQIVNSTETSVNVIDSQTNQTGSTVPAQFVEMTYSTSSAPNEIREGYFILTATNATQPNVGMTKGYSIFYESSSAVAAEITTTTSASSNLPATPLSTAVAQVFGSFELIAAPGVVTEQAIVQTEQTEQAGGFGQVEQIECDPSYPGVCIPPPPPDFNCGDEGVPENFAVSGSDPHGFDADNDGIGCEDGNGDGDNGGDDSDDNGGDTSCHPSYPDECIPPPPPNLNCDDVDATNFAVSGSDPHGFDGDNDGIGCESGGDSPDEPGDGGDDDNGGGDGGGDDGGGEPEPEPEPEPGSGDDDGGEGGGEGEGGEGNPNDFDDCVVPPGMEPGDVGC